MNLIKLKKERKEVRSRWTQQGLITAAAVLLRIGEFGTEHEHKSHWPVFEQCEEQTRGTEEEDQPCAGSSLQRAQPQLTGVR